MQADDVHSLLSLMGDCILVAAVNDENDSWHKEFRWILDSVGEVNDVLVKYPINTSLGYDEEEEKNIIF